MNAHKLSKHNSQNHVIETLFNREFFFDSIYNLFVAKLKILKIYIDEYIKKKIHYRVRVVCECFYTFRQEVKWQVLFMRRLLWVERDNNQKSIFVVFDQWKFEQIIRNKDFFTIERSKCFSSHSHKKWRRMKNNV